MRDGALVYQGELDALKESFARVYLHAPETLPPRLEYPGLCRQKIQGKQAQLVFNPWQESLVPQLAAAHNAKVDVEYLGLEDIFLELNP